MSLNRLCTNGWKNVLCNSESCFYMKLTWMVGLLMRTKKNRKYEYSSSGVSPNRSLNYINI